MTYDATQDRTPNLSQARSNILPQNFLTGCFLKESIETQNLGKDQTLPALPAVTALLHTIGLIGSVRKFKPSLHKEFIFCQCFVIVFLVNEKLFLTTGFEFVNAVTALYFNWQVQKFIFFTDKI